MQKLCAFSVALRAKRLCEPSFQMLSTSISPTKLDCKIAQGQKYCKLLDWNIMRMRTFVPFFIFLVTNASFWELKSTTQACLELTLRGRLANRQANSCHFFVSSSLCKKNVGKTLFFFRKPYTSSSSIGPKITNLRPCLGLKDTLQKRHPQEANKHTPMAPSTSKTKMNQTGSKQKYVFFFFGVNISFTSSRSLWLFRMILYSKFSWQQARIHWIFDMTWFSCSLQMNSSKVVKREAQHVSNRLLLLLKSSGHSNLLANQSPATRKTHDQWKIKKHHKSTSKPLKGAWLHPSRWYPNSLLIFVGHQSQLLQDPTQLQDQATLQPTAGQASDYDLSHPTS